MPELFVACTDLSALSTYFYKIAIRPPSLQAPKPPSFQSASAGDAKRKQSAARSSRQACRTPREAKHADMHDQLGHADMNVGHADMHVLREGAALAGGRAAASPFGG